MKPSTEADRTRTCWCGTTFVFPPGKGFSRTHCSRKCREALRRQKKRQQTPDATLRTRSCAECGAEFSYPIGRGSDRLFCSDSCRTRRRHAHAKTKPLCVVEGCRNPRQYSSGICNGCYYRLRRTGTLERRVWKYRSLGSHGYVSLFDRDHPMSTPQGFVYEHRKVLYDAIGSGPHPCHWCKTSLDWTPSAKAGKGVLVVDHLDGVKANNDLANLVPACNRCNASRGSFMAWVREHQDDPILWAMYLASKAKLSA